MLAVLAGLAVVGFLASRRDRRWLVAVPVALAVGLAAVPWGLGDVRRTWSGLEALNHARRLMVLDGVRDDAHLRREAEALLDVAAATVPQRADVWRLRARNLQRDGRADAALAVLTEGAMVAADPVALARQGRRDEARQELRAGLDRLDAGAGRALLAENLRRLDAAGPGR
jgi:hypothetical protein